ncbi:MAG TPA: SHOCT domain-containing protein [Bacteroidia bacterium]|nr:SHOCT domain-containing protein [Bacteroidia bacterium]
MNRKEKISTVTLFFLYVFNFGNFTYAQVKNPVVKTSLVSLTKAEAEIDSLNNVIVQIKEGYEKALKINQGKDSLIDELDGKILKTQQVNNDLERKLAGYKGDNLKLDQSNRILIIFNAIVGVLLLTTLIWFLRNIGRKKSPGTSKPAPFNESSSSSNLKTPTSSKNDHQYFDLKLEQLEKLGALKEKGVLNEEEFNRQKQQILGNG